MIEAELLLPLLLFICGSIFRIRGLNSLGLFARCLEFFAGCFIAAFLSNFGCRLTWYVEIYWYFVPDYSTFPEEACCPQLFTTLLSGQIFYGCLGGEFFGEFFEFLITMGLGSVAGRASESFFWGWLSVIGCELRLLTLFGNNLVYYSSFG